MNEVIAYHLATLAGLIKEIRKCRNSQELSDSVGTRIRDTFFALTNKVYEIMLGDLDVAAMEMVGGMNEIYLMVIECCETEVTYLRDSLWSGKDRDVKIAGGLTPKLS